MIKNQDALFIKVDNTVVEHLSESRYSLAVYMYIVSNLNKRNRCNTSIRQIMGEYGLTYYSNRTTHTEMIEDLYTLTTGWEDEDGEVTDTALGFSILNYGEERPSYKDDLIIEVRGIKNGVVTNIINCYFQVYYDDYYHLLDHCIEQQVSSVTALNLYGYILSHQYGQCGFCNCGIRTIAQDLGISEHTVQTYIDVLVDAKLIYAERGVKNRSNKYYRYDAYEKAHGPLTDKPREEPVVEPDAAETDMPPAAVTYSGKPKCHALYEKLLDDLEDRDFDAWDSSGSTSFDFDFSAYDSFDDIF